MNRSAILAYIPSPAHGSFQLGPLTLHMYGLMLLLGIATAIWLTRRRWASWGGDPDLVFRVALWGVLAGLVGARIYHLLTSWNQDAVLREHWWGIFAVWDGGLGIWGAVVFGAAAGAWVVHRSGSSIRLMMDAAAPGLLAAQAIGRWGNYWNQELYGQPTSLPWSLRIDAAHQDAILPHYRHAPYGYYTPTFLYESIWNGIGVALLLWLDRRFRLRRPALFALYVAWYTTFRTYEEILRIDPSNHLAGMRINFWVSLTIWLLSVAFFVWWQFIHPNAAAKASARRERAQAAPTAADRRAETSGTRAAH